LEQLTSNSNFEKLNFNLKKLIYSYLETYDLLTVYHLNKNFRKHLPDSATKFNRDNVKVLAFALSLKNKNSYLEKHYFINYLRDKNIIPIIISYMKGIQNLPEQEILIGIANYFKICQEKFKEKNLKLNFDDNPTIMIALTKLLDKEKFIYSAIFEEILNEEEYLNEKLESLLNNLKFIKIIKFDFYGTNFYENENGIEKKYMITVIKIFIG
jgi:hypothetical protein